MGFSKLPINSINGYLISKKEINLDEHRNNTD